MDKWRNKHTLFLVSKLFFHTNPHFHTDLHNKGANLPILGCQRGNAACLRPLSHAVFVHIVLHSCEGAAGGWGGGSHKPFWEISVLLWKMGDDNGAQVDVRRSFQRVSAHLAFSRDETFWQRERKTHKKAHDHNPPPSPQPPFPQIKCVFQGRNNSGSSPMTLCVQLSQRITWFIYSLECCNRMIELLFFIFFIRSVWCVRCGLWSGQRYDEHDGVWQLRSKSPVCWEKCRCSTFLNGDAYWFLIFLMLGNNRQEHPPPLEQI